LHEAEPGQQSDAAELAQFDRVVFTTVQQRSDPCTTVRSAPGPTKG
jgi:hypothetical protein